MYKISLLPVQYKLAIIRERKNNDIIISFVFTIIILSILSILAFVVNAAIKNEYAIIKAENSALLSENNDLSNYNEMQLKLLDDTGKIQVLAGEAPSFPRTLSAITQTVPDSLQILKIKYTYSQETKKSLFEVGGNAAYYDDVALWIDRLNKVESIGEVMCSYTTVSSASSLNRIQFELKMDILDKSAFDDVVWQWGVNE